MTLRIGSLFSGIGGLELGLERAGIGVCVWQVEIDAKRRAVLAKHWPNAKRFADVRAVQSCRNTCMPENALDKVEVICGGFPCQDVSQAARGRNRGLDGERSGLWREYARIVGEMHPALVIVENVFTGKRRWLPTVRRDLHVLGYRTRALRVDARDVGAPHARARIFVVAYPYEDGKPALSKHGEVARMPSFAELGGCWRNAKPTTLRMDDGIPGGMDRVEMLGDSVVPDAAELVGRLIRSWAIVAPTRQLTKAVNL